MVAAHLRGLIKPELKYGVRSELTEHLLLEAMMADVQADHYAASSLADAAALPILTDESKEMTMRSIKARLSRKIELNTMDLYRLDRNARRASSDKNDISLYQLYHLAQKEGILDALNDHTHDPDE